MKIAYYKILYYNYTIFSVDFTCLLLLQNLKKYGIIYLILTSNKLWRNYEFAGFLFVRDTETFRN